MMLSMQSNRVRLCVYHKQTDGCKWAKNKHMDLGFNLLN